MTIKDSEISDLDRRHRDANIMAAKTSGFKRWVFLKFSAFFGWAGDLGREIKRDEQRGKDDNYHDEY